MLAVGATFGDDFLFQVRPNVSINGIIALSGRK